MDRSMDRWIDGSPGLDKTINLTDVQTNVIFDKYMLLWTVPRPPHSNSKEIKFYSENISQILFLLHANEEIIDEWMDKHNLETCAEDSMHDGHSRVIRRPKPLNWAIYSVRYVLESYNLLILGTWSTLHLQPQGSNCLVSGNAEMTLYSQMASCQCVGTVANKHL